MLHSVVIHEKPPSKRCYIRSNGNNFKKFNTMCKTRTIYWCDSLLWSFHISFMMIILQITEWSHIFGVWNWNIIKQSFAFQEITYFRLLNRLILFFSSVFSADVVLLSFKIYGYAGLCVSQIVKFSLNFINWPSEDASGVIVQVIPFLQNIMHIICNHCNPHTRPSMGIVGLMCVAVTFGSNPSSPAVPGLWYYANIPPWKLLL